MEGYKGEEVYLCRHGLETDVDQTRRTGLCRGLGIVGQNSIMFNSSINAKFGALDRRWNYCT